MDGTKVIFDIAQEDGKTLVRFTQAGLTPEIECFNSCSIAWRSYITGSLRKLIETGKGGPTQKKIEEKSECKV
jgi:hypothetical protein